jgi:hypothetical protein
VPSGQLALTASWSFLVQAPTLPPSSIFPG